ncbi:heterokaryon incompatibility protein-domain-containing protein [Trametes meyenii]|nr:heterokaryon incompatibility protein-domain-containing protein [Trametes meyenii]
MYLLNTETFELHRFDDKQQLPPYAILSHVWGDREQTFQDTPVVKDSQSRRGPFQRASDLALRRPSKKIRGACTRARQDGWSWLWADTSCIDTTNSAQLSETINSMFTLYRNASMCYAYLEDVPSGQDLYPLHSSFRRSRWFKRVWTLQELIAPPAIIFLSSDWRRIGSKWRLAELIESITGIDRLVLTHKRPLEEVSVACRMSWAATREARREEDRAYSLMGIFGVCMPTIYGERERAFFRLQEEIIKRTPDQSIFAWGRALHDHGSGTLIVTAQKHDYDSQSDMEGLFATSPADFRGCADISPIELSDFATLAGLERENVPIYAQTGAGICTTLPIAHSPDSQDTQLGLLACVDGNGRLVALYLRAHPNMSSKLLVGGFVAEGGRRNAYCRTTRLNLSEKLLVSPVLLKEVIIHSSRPFSTKALSSSSKTASTASHSSFIFFQPPCSITLSQSSQKELQRMGYILPVIPDRGFRLASAGDTRSLSFLGDRSFTVHFGVCALDAKPGSTQNAQLWASAAFDSFADQDSLCAAHSEMDDSLDACEAENAGPYPTQSALVQYWKDHQKTFGERGREVRLTFSYPCSASDLAPERGMAEIYELEVSFRGYYSQNRRRRHYKGSAASYSIGSISSRTTHGH